MSEIYPLFCIYRISVRRKPAVLAQCRFVLMQQLERLRQLLAACRICWTGNAAGVAQLRSGRQQYSRCRESLGV